MTSESPLKIAVIGGNGHVGRGVVRRALDDGHTVVSLDIAAESVVPLRDRLLYSQVDASRFDDLKKAITTCTAVVLLSAAYNQHDDEGLITDAEKVPQHYIHNMNVSMSYNTLNAAVQLGINRVTIASSINALGMYPRYDFFPITEEHPCRPEEAYSLSKYLSELQADAMCRRYPTMRVASLRFHWVVPDPQVNRDYLDSFKGSWKDLWGWVSLQAAADSVLKSLTAHESSFPIGHEVFFIVAGTTCQQCDTRELLQAKFPGVTDIRQALSGNGALFDCKKAERMLGWKEEGFPSGSK